jgi:hypothetical protein
LKYVIFRRLTHAGKVDSQTVLGQAEQRALGKKHGHVGIARPKAVIQGVFLDRVAHEKLEEFAGGGALPRVAPWDVKNVEGMLVPNIGLGIVDTKLTPSVPRRLQVIDRQVFMNYDTIIFQNTRRNREIALKMGERLTDTDHSGFSVWPDWCKKPCRPISLRLIQR